MSKMRRIALALFVITLPVFAAIPLPNAPTKYVTDAAGVIPDDRELALNERLAQFERDTTNQVIVYVDRSVPAGTTLEEMGAEAIKTWAVGQVKKDNGAILFLFVDDRESRIEVGYGLEGTLTDAHSKRILVGMRDALRAGDYAAAVDSAAAAILDTIRSPQAVQQEAQQAAAAAPRTSDIRSTVFFSMIALFVIGMLIALARTSTREPVVPFSSPDPPDSPDFPDSSSGWSSSSNDSFSSSIDFSSSDSSSSSSSSDFSGGGGSGGGGGASDKW